MDSKGAGDNGKQEEVAFVEKKKDGGKVVKMTIGDGDSTISNTTAKNKREAFSQRFKTISVDTPPSKDPIGFTRAAVMAVPRTGLNAFSFVLGVGFSCILSIAAIVIGALYFDDANCPPEKLALLLIVCGSLNVFTTAVDRATTRTKTMKSTNVDAESGEITEEEKKIQTQHPIFKTITGIGRLAGFIGFIWTCVAVYRLFPNVVYEDEMAEMYCNAILYKFTFWSMTISLCLLGFILFTCGCCLCCACCVGLAAMSK